MNNLDYTFSKAFQSEETIKKMYEQAFNKKSDNLKITLLDGGMKCAVYLILNDDEKVVLKVAPADQKLLLSYERNTMWWEVQMLELLKNFNIPIPQILYYDDSKKICKSPYFFMSYIEGKKLSDYKGILDDESRMLIEYELGKICYKLSKIEGNEYFISSYSDIIFSNNYDFIKKLFESLILDAKSKNIIIPNHNYEDFILMLDNNKTQLNNVKRICLVHSDIWDGNIIIKDGKISGIVDFADLYFCDELFNFYFHTLQTKTSKSFINGFGKDKLSFDEEIRIIIYRIFTILKMIIEKDYKKFSDKNTDFSWLYNKLEKEIQKLNEYNTNNTRRIKK